MKIPKEGGTECRCPLLLLRLVGFQLLADGLELFGRKCAIQ